MGLLQKSKVLAMPAILRAESGVVLDVSARFTRSAREVTRLLDNHAQARSQKDYARLGDITTKLLKASSLVTIKPSFRDSQLVQQLVDNPLEVHKLDSVKAFQKLRLSDGLHKDCQSLVVQSSKGKTVLAPIFRVKVALPTQDGQINPWDIPSGVDVLKNETPRAISDNDNAEALISVSAIYPKTAPHLIGALDDDYPKITVSPMRMFTGANNRAELLANNSDEQIRAMVVDHLSRRTDPVIKLHMGNGAYLGWVHINRNAPLDSQEWIEAGFVYNSPMAETIKDSFQDAGGHISASGALLEQCSSAVRLAASRIDTPIIARTSVPAVQ